MKKKEIKDLERYFEREERKLKLAASERKVARHIIEKRRKKNKLARQARKRNR